jgi:uncharacterized membrane protein
MADHITHSIVVQGMLPDVYKLWANFENFPIFMEHIKSVRKTGEKTSHWVMQGPLGTAWEWEAETTRMDKNARIAWNSKDNSELKTSGQVTFRELGPNETEVTVTMHYDPPAGAAGEALAQLLANPDKRVREDLERFKRFVETTTERLNAGRDE